MQERYRAFNDYLKKRFGLKVRKIVLNAGFTCPTRDGTKGTRGCIYCNELGSGSGSTLSLKDQMNEQMARWAKKGWEKFILYFQSFTNTYASIDELKKAFDHVKLDKRIVGMSIGTRPDCLDTEKIELLKSYRSQYEVWVELGLQTIHQITLDLIQRGHTVKEFDNAMELLKNTGLKVCVHVIFGLPGETQEQMIETIHHLKKYKIHGIKFHSLYIEKGTRLAEMYENDPFVLQSQEEYCNTVVEALKLLPGDVVIQRLTGDGDPERTIAPDWALQKNETRKIIETMLEIQNTSQGAAAK